MTQQVSPSEVARIFDAELRDEDRAVLEELGPRYNVAPTQPITVVVEQRLELADEEADRLALHLRAELVLFLEHDSRRGAERAVVEVGDARVKCPVLTQSS